MPSFASLGSDYFFRGRTFSPYRVVRRRRRIALLDGLRRLRVLPPLASLPVGLHGWRPPDERPSPPPIGCDTGFWATPRTCGRRPSQRLRPALPSWMFMWSALPSWPTVARQLELTRR